MAFLVKISGTDVSFPAEKGERILDAAERAGYDIPHACRSGFCGSCSANVVSGDFITYAPGSKEGVPSHGPKILTCSTEAASDVEIAVQIKKLVRNIPVTVAAMDRVAPDAIRLVLKADSGKPIEFIPGQFVDILLENKERRSYSIACDTPAENGLELHIRHVPGGLFTDRRFGVKGEPIQVGTKLEIAAPAGDFHLHKRTPHDILILVTGTGFAPAKAMIENFIKLPSAKPHQVYLYWGGRHKVDLYMDELCRKWDAEHEWFHYCPVLSRPDESEGWTGRVGHVQDQFLADHPDASQYDAYICGTPRLVTDAVNALTAAGLDKDCTYSDSFTSKKDTL